MMQCPICGNRIRDQLTTVVHRETGKPAHFDCVISELKKAERIPEREKVYYLGGGCFGVVTEQRRSPNRTKIVVKKKIQYEDRERSPGSARGQRR